MSSRGGLGLIGPFWGALLLILAIGILNPQMEVVSHTPETQTLEPLTYFPYLPAALVADRALAYSFLLSGAMIQGAMLWLYLRRRSHIRLLVAGLAINGLILAVLGAVLHLAGTAKILGLFEPVNPRFFASFRYYNHWVAFALLSMGQCAALGVYFFLRSRSRGAVSRRKPELFWISALVLISITLPMSGSRAGMLFFAVFWVYALWRGLIAIRRKGGVTEGAPAGALLGSGKVQVALLAVFALGVAGYGFVISRDRIEDRLRGTLGDIDRFQQGGGLDDRFIYAWEDTWRMIEERPLLGWGFGCHKYAFMMFAGDHYREEDGTLFAAKEFAHNDWLQFVAELGMIGFFCLVAVPMAVILRLRDRGPAPPSSVWLLVGGALVLVLATFEFPLSNPAVLVLFFVQGAAAFRYWSLSLPGERAVVEKLKS
jgi:O-antigen ligase